MGNQIWTSICIFHMSVNCRRIWQTSFLFILYFSPMAQTLLQREANASRTMLHSIQKSQIWNVTKLPGYDTIHVTLSIEHDPERESSKLNSTIPLRMIVEVWNSYDGLLSSCIQQITTETFKNITDSLFCYNRSYYKLWITKVVRKFGKRWICKQNSKEDFQ